MNFKKLLFLGFLLITLVALPVSFAADNNLSDNSLSNLDNSYDDNLIIENVSDNGNLKESSVSNYDELDSTIRSLENSSYNDYTINLNNGNYIASKTINFNNSAIKLTINGNNQVINGNSLQFLTLNKVNLILNDLTITNCLSPKGSAIYGYGSNLTLNNITFKSNSASGLYGEGGAIYLNNSKLYINNSEFIDNSASAAGGLYLYESISNIENSKFKSNYAKWYGGVLYSIGNLTIENSVFSENIADFKGGAIHTSESPNVESIVRIYDCELYSNSAEFGAAVSTSSKNYFVIDGSLLYNNTAKYGGIIARFSIGDINLTNDIIYNNKAIHGAVIYYVTEGIINLINDEIYNNSADEGTIIYAMAGSLWVNNTFNIENSFLYDNIMKKGLFYQGEGNYTIFNSSITLNNNVYDDYVLYKFGTGNITLISNWWGTSTPNYSKLIYVPNGTINSSEDIISYSINNFPATTNNLGEEDCSSNVIQIDENHSVISFRRDSSSNLDIYLFQDDSLVKQFKTAATYFFSVIVTKDGWFVGTGGLDAPFINEKVEALAMEVVKSGKITEEYMQAILNLKLISGTGHCLIKAPNGNYGLITANKAVKGPMLEISKLNSGEYIVCPNSPLYYSKGDYLSKTGISDPVIASRYLAATDKYTLKQRHDILTYNFTKDDNGSHVDVYVANDDNHLVTDSSDLTYCDGIWILSKYKHISPVDIPVIMNGLYVNTFYFNDSINHTNSTKNVKIIVKNIKAISGSKTKIKIYLVDEDNNKVKSGKITIKLNGKTYSVNVHNGVAIVKIDIPSNGTYIATVYYYGGKYYNDSSQEFIIISLPDPNPIPTPIPTPKYKTVLDNGGNMENTGNPILVLLIALVAIGIESFRRKF